MKITTVLFDLDGVLVDACNWHYDALNMALRQNNFESISIEDHNTKYNGLPTRIKLKMLGISDNLSTKINEDKQRYTLTLIEQNAKIMQEKIELHKFLKDNFIKIGCVTNSIRETAVKMLTQTGQYEYIDLLISNEDVDKNKPNPKAYNLAIQKLNANPLETMCVEDSPKGIEAATKSLAKNLWVVKNPNEVTKNNFIEWIKDIK